MTFIHRARPELEQVNVLVRSIIVPERFDASAMTLLPDSDVWATTLRLDRRRRGSYAFAATGPDQPRDEIDQATRSRMLDAADPSVRLMVERYLQAFEIQQPDPLAAHYRPGGYSEMILPDAAPVPWLPDLSAETAKAEHGGEPEGVVHDQLGERRVWLYQPAGTDPDRPLPVVVLLDGAGWSTDAPATVSGMTARGQLPPLLAVGIASGAHRWDDLRCSDLFTNHLAEDLLGWAAQRQRITDDPARTIVAGQSLGGLAALFATQYRPDRFGCAIAQSGSFWWPSPQEWLTEVIRAHDQPAQRLYLSLGSDETGRMRTAMTRMVTALTDRGDPLEFREYDGGHDPASWRADLSDGLASLTAHW